MFMKSVLEILTLKIPTETINHKKNNVILEASTTEI